MSTKIGFCIENTESETVALPGTEPVISSVRKSLVQVYFPQRGMKCTYYNDSFDLHKGDSVYVEGKLEGELGRVVEVEYNFKIKLSYYKKVIAVADTSIHGEFQIFGTHFITFDKNALPFEKLVTWFKAPEKDDEIIAETFDDKSFSLCSLSESGVSKAVFDRGCEYYAADKVVYVSIENGKGHAIVRGGNYYEVEFEYKNGIIKNPTCDCYCVGICSEMAQS